MECLENLIGIKGCEDKQGTFFVNDLPGMSLKVADAGAFEDNANGVELIKDRIKFASNYVASDLRAFLSNKFFTKEILEESFVGYFQDLLINASARIKGVRISIKEEKFISISINKIGLKLGGDETTPVYIYDLLSGIKLFETEIESKADQIVFKETEFRYNTNGRRTILFVCRESIEDSYKTNLFDNSIYGCTSCNEGGFLTYTKGGYIESGDSFRDSNFTTSSDTGGLAVDFNIECSQDAYVCSIKNQLAWPMLFKTGAMILKEVINSKQSNTVVMIHREDNLELLDYYESEYTKAMNLVTLSLKMPNGFCFECNPRIKKQIQLP